MTSAEQWPHLSFGAGGLPSTVEEVKQVLSGLEERGITQIDTARIYPNSEELLGAADAPAKFAITTKVAGFTFPEHGTRRVVLECAKQSLEMLKVDKVTTYLLHTRDTKTPITETMDAIQELYEQGKFERFGVSNFTAEQVQECYDYAKSKGYVLPTVYQANYNLVARKNETLLFPTLRGLGIRLQVYSPIAGGFLTKTPEQILNPQPGGRWDPSTMTGRVYNALYNKPTLVEYLRKFDALSKKSGISKSGIAYRWVRFNSELKDDDVLILGARTLEQLDETLAELKKGPLEPWVVQELEKMWKEIENDAPVNNADLLQ